MQKYSLTILYEEAAKKIGVGEVSKTLNLKEGGYTDKRYIINEEEVYIDTHNVGFGNVKTQNTKLIIVEVAPAFGNIEGDTEGWLYVSENFYPRPTTVTTLTSSVISAKVRLAQDLYGLIINGQEKGVVPPNYTINSTTSSIIGEVTWAGLTLNRGDYFSIIETTNGTLNPFSAPVYTGRYV